MNETIKFGAFVIEFEQIVRQRGAVIPDITVIEQYFDNTIDVQLAAHHHVVEQARKSTTSVCPACQILEES